MHGRSHDQAPAELAALARRFVAWRRSRVLGARIPEQLWNDAVDAAARHGVSRTATALAVGYYDLRKRLDRSSHSQHESPSATVYPEFVELPALSLAAAGECVIEFEKASGARMRMQLKGASIPDLATLARDFWGFS